MWTDLSAAVRRFPTSVVSWPDDAGYPVSARVTPDLDDARQVVAVQAPAGLELRAGPASLMSHQHDERTWNLKSFLCRGRLEQDGDGWVFRPTVFVPGAGTGGPLGQLRYVLDARRAAARYLQRRSLPRPRIPWDRINRSH